MGITGRYDFSGIQKAVGIAIDALLSATSWGVWLVASPFAPVVTIIRNMIVNWLANQGLIILNLGAIQTDGVIDQTKLDSALDDAFNKLKVGRDKITPAQGEAIDDEVRDAFDQDADVGATNSGSTGDTGGVSNVSSASVRSGNNPSL